MKPVAFDYMWPGSVGEALEALAAAPDAKVLAGGQTLGPMLNLRLAQPGLLVDITRIPELAIVEEGDQSVTIGAIVTHAAIEDGHVPGPTGTILARVARGIGYRAVRTRGTIGGSLAHADPAADWLSCLVALAAEVLIDGARSRRRLRVADLMRGAMESALEADELITAIHIPKCSPRVRFGFHKICRKAGEFADAIGVVVDDPGRDFFCAVSGATSGRPLIVTRVEPQVGAPSVGEVRALLEAAGFTGDAYELTLHAVALQRAYREANAA
jgi:carbon-monoxide dehydrogenase medium subunit